MAGDESGSVSAVQEALGHKSQATTRVYLQRYQRRTPLSEALAVLPTAEKKPAHQDGRHATQRELAAPNVNYGGLLAGLLGLQASCRAIVLQINGPMSNLGVSSPIRLMTRA